MIYHNRHILLAIVVVLSLTSISYAQCELQAIAEPKGLGWRVHMDESTVVMTPWTTLVDPHYVSMKVISDLHWNALPDIITNTSTGSAGFGSTIYVNGEWLIVNNKFNSRFNVYRQLNGEWVLWQIIDFPLPCGSPASASINGDEMLIGSADWGCGEQTIFGIGRVFIYQLIDDYWQYSDVIINPFEQSDAYFGFAVALQGNRAVIGAQGAFNMGRTYIYDLIDDEWVLIVELVPQLKSSFGRDVAIGGTTIAVAAPSSCCGNNFLQGQTHIYGPEDGQYTVINGMDVPAVKPTSNGSILFGSSVELSDDGLTLLVGARQDSEIGFQQGAAFLFRYEEGQWVFKKKLIGSLFTGGENSAATHTLSMAGDFAIIGSINSPNPGNAVIFGGMLGIDCNNNGEPDTCDIFHGTSVDINANGIPDECETPITILTSIPPNNAIDARQPFQPDGANSTGISSIELIFSGDTASFTPADFTVSSTSGLSPTVTQVDSAGTNATLALSGPIPVTAWTTITHTPSGSQVRLGYLPADINNNGTANAADILTLIDHLNGLTPLAIYQTDIDRSGATSPADILRAIDLLNGAGAYPVFNGASLP